MFSIQLGPSGDFSLPPHSSQSLAFIPRVTEGDFLSSAAQSVDKTQPAHSVWQQRV